ncbi:MAG: hypothetical protein RI907_1668, partial [Pseudomonadota bacterium]
MSQVPSNQAGGKPIKVALVTNIPAPYRVAVFRLLARMPGIQLRVFFFAGAEPDRHWQETAQPYDHVFLRERMVSVAGRFIHFNPDLWGALQDFRPDVVVTTGFNPSHLMAYAYARWRGCAHVPMTDGTPQSESGLTGVHRFVRRWVYGRSQAFIGASQASLRLLASYGAAPGAMFQSHLCADNARFAAEPDHPKVHDLLFCGRFVPVKCPLFAMDVAQACAVRLQRRVSLGILGAGEMEGEMRAKAATLSQVDVHWLGFAQPDDLPGHFKRAKVYLFPTTF